MLGGCGLGVALVLFGTGKGGIEMRNILGFELDILMWSQPFLHVLGTAGHPGVGLASCCVDSPYSVTLIQGWGLTAV